MYSIDVTIFNFRCRIGRMNKEEFIDDVVPIRGELENYAFSFMKNKEEVEDIMQEVYIKLWCMRDKLKEYRSINALAFIITKNLCINALNIKKRTVSSELVLDNRKGDFQPDKQLIEKDDLEKVLTIVEQLPSLQQAILRMRHIEELEIDEIVKITGCAEGAIRTNLSRARNRVRTLFMEMNDEKN